jgi:hypothetical protein
MIQRSSLTSLWPSQRGITNRTARTKPHQALLAIALVLGITIVLCLYLLQTSKINVRNYDIYELQGQLITLQRDNTNALAKLAYEQSITQMDKRAIAAGYRPIQSVLYLPINPEQSPTQFVDETLNFAAADSSRPVESVFMREQ